MARVRHFAAASCGLLAVALALFVPVVGGSAQPGYSHRSQFISELGASGATNASLVSTAGFAPIGVLILAFLALAAGLLPEARQAKAGVLSLGAVGVAYLVAAVFPCDAGCPTSGSLSQRVHNTFGLLEYVGALIGLVLLGAAFRESVVWRPLFPMCVGCAFVVGVGFVAMLLPQLESIRGASQRIAEAAIFFWVAVVSVFLAVRGHAVRA